ncbi:MAG: hypothetical protein U1E43_00580 [Rhodospirillales bacterium]
MPLPASPAHLAQRHRHRLLAPDPGDAFCLQISLSATAIGAAIRQHWGIENRSHYVRDVSFFEDHSRIRSKPGHFARFRSFALNILRANGITNVSRELYLNALNPNHPIAYRSA